MFTKFGKPMIFFSPDPDAGGGTDSGNSGENDGSAKDEKRSYSQAELDAMFSERAKQAKSSAMNDVLKALGVEKLEDAKTLIADKRKSDELSKSDADKVQEKISLLERTNTELTQKHKLMMAQYEVAITAAKIGIVDPDAAYRLIDHSKIEYGSDEKPSNVEALLKELVKQKPYLVGGSTSASNPSKTHDDSDPVYLAARKAAGLPID